MMLALYQWFTSGSKRCSHSSNRVTYLTQKRKEVDDESAVVLSGENPGVLRVKQFLYDVAGQTHEALRQAEYLSKGAGTSSVHFEMSGFSDRMLGRPSKMMMLIHSGNPNLDLAQLKPNTRNSLRSYLSSEVSGKEFTTAAEYGPSSLITMIFTRAPSADIGDQFYNLINSRTQGLAGVDPDWALKTSKLHPYIFIYNLIWLSVQVAGVWTHKANKLFARRFQIPTAVIEHHYSRPMWLDDFRSRRLRTIKPVSKAMFVYRSPTKEITCKFSNNLEKTCSVATETLGNTSASCSCDITNTWDLIFRAK